MEHKWIDVSATVFDGMVRWPDDPPVHIYKVEEIGKEGAVANVTAISTTAHLGTHIDAPLHFVKDGTDVASVDLGRLVGTAKVFHIHNDKEIALDDIKDLPIAKGDRVLFHTRNSDTDWQHQSFMKNYVYLSAGAAKLLAEKQVACVGIDYLSIGGGDENPEVHRSILGNSIIIIEGLILGEIEDGEYDMVCLPIKIQHSDGAPARVILRKKIRV